MDYPVISVRMSGKLVKEFHISDSGLVCACADLLERRESHKELSDHFVVCFFRKNLLHLQKKLVMMTKLINFTKFIPNMYRI